MSLTLLLVVLAIAGLMTWFSIAGKQPVVHAPLSATLTRALFDALLYRGINITQLAISVRDDPRVLLFSKYIHEERGAGISAKLPREPGTEAYWDSLREELTRHGIHFTEVDDAGARAVSMLLDVGQDIERAQLVAHIVFERVFGLRLERDCVARFNEHLLPVEVPRLTGIRRQQS